MKKFFKWMFPLLFLLLCAGVFRFLWTFTSVKQMMQYISWDSILQVNEDGSLTPYTPDAYGNTGSASQVGKVFRLSAVIPEGLGTGTLLFETSGEELALWLNGTEIYHSSALLPAETMGLSQAQIPLMVGVSGELTRECTILDDVNRMFPPLLRFLPDELTLAEPMAQANLYGMPAGVAAMGLLLAMGLFFLGIARGYVDISLIPLSIAMASLMIFRLAQNCGYYFLPASVNHLLIWPGFRWVAPLALLVYLALNRRRNFWRLLGVSTLWSAGALLAAYLVSLARGWYLAQYLNLAFYELFTYGIYDGLLYWFTFWLAAVSILSSAYQVVRTFVRQCSETRALALKNQLILDSYHAIENQLADSAALRHEIRHQLTALKLLFQKKDYQGLDSLLEQLQQQEGQLAQTQFTENFTVNAILQDASTRAARAQVAFEAQAHLPETLPIPDSDLCVLLMNLLDNALEASAQVAQPDRRFLRFRAEVKNGFLTIKCENRYAGELRWDEKGRLLTTKPEHTELHGLGLQTALKLPWKKAS